MNSFSPSALKKRKDFKKSHGFCPESLVVGITDKCNLKCEYCYSNSGYNCSSNIDLDKLSVILDEMRDSLGIRFITVTGGEPFPLILKLARQRPDITFICYTNSTSLADKEVCKEMKNLGNIICSITIIGERETHDSIRGHGNYETVLKAIKNLRDYALIWGFAITESTINYDQIIKNDLIENLNKHDPFYFRLIPFMPVGRNQNYDLSLTKEQRKIIGNKIRKLNMDESIVIHDYINDPSYGLNCMAGGRSSFYINEDLQISPCVFIDIFRQIEFDTSCKKSNLLEILSNDKLFNNVRKLAEIFPHCMVLNDPYWREHIECDCNDNNLAALNF